MAAQKVTKVFLAAMLAVGLMPSFAFALADNGGSDDATSALASEQDVGASGAGVSDATLTSVQDVGVSGADTSSTGSASEQDTGTLSTGASDVGASGADVSGVGASSGNVSDTDVSGVGASGADEAGEGQNSSGNSSLDVEMLAEATTSSLSEKAAANKDTLPDGVYFISTSLNESKVLDVVWGSAANGANVQLYAANMTDAQQWRVVHDNLGYVTFINVKSNKALDVAGGSAKSGANVQQYEQNDTAAQKWVVSQNTDGSYTIESALKEGISLDVSGATSTNGTNIQIYTANNTTAQHFVFTNIETDVEPCARIESLESGYFTIASSVDSSYVLDVASGSRANGANIQLYTSNNTYAQLYTFQFVESTSAASSATGKSEGYYLVVNAKSGCALDVENGSVISGANVQQYASSSANDNQLFSVEANGDGTYTFINKAGGLALDVSGGNAANAANVQGWKSNNTAAQKWVVSSVLDLMPEGIMKISSALDTSAVLDVENGSRAAGVNVQVYTSNGSQAQKWQVKRIASNTYTIQAVHSGKNLAANSDGNVIVKDADANDTAQQWIPSISSGQTVLTNKGTGKVLDVAGGSSESGTNVQVYTSNNSTAQRFEITATSLIGEGTYIIEAFSNSNMAVDVVNGSSSNGADIQLYTSNDTGAQKWKISQNSDGTYTFRNAASGKVLDVRDGFAAAGTAIQLYSSNGSLAQKWYAAYIDGGALRFVSALDSSYALDLSAGVTDGSRIQLGTQSGAETQKFTLEPTTYVPPLPSDQLEMLNYIAGLSSNTQYLLAVNRGTHKVGVFEGFAGNWNLIYYWSCVTGTSATPTITGIFHTTGGKRSALSTDSRAIYCTQIYGGYFFHSILESESELGQSLSHGCIRMAYSSALWIYNNVWAGTTVVIYN